MEGERSKKTYGDERRGVEFRLKTYTLILEIFPSF